MCTTPKGISIVHHVIHNKNSFSEPFWLLGLLRMIFIVFLCNCGVCMCEFMILLWFPHRHLLIKFNNCRRNIFFNSFHKFSLFEEWKFYEVWNKFLNKIIWNCWKWFLCDLIINCSMCHMTDLSHHNGSYATFGIKILCHRHVTPQLYVKKTCHNTI